MRSLATLLSLALLASPAAAQSSDLWSEPQPGVRYLDRHARGPVRVHALLVDLRADGVRLAASPYEQRWSTVSDAAHTQRFAAAINGGFWGAMQRPCGLAAGGGALWPTSSVDPELGSLVIDRRGRARIRAPGEPLDERALEDVSEAVSGRPLLLDAGEIATDALATFPTSTQRAPRTAVGLDANRRLAILVVVDGRQRESRGMTLYELAALMQELGAERALNLDGGGSSEMWVGRLGGVVNVPSRGRWEAALGELVGEAREARETPRGTEVYVRGTEREVMNVLGVIAPEPSGVPVRAFEDPLGIGIEVDAPVAPPPPAPPWLRLGALRETLVPLAWLSGALVAVLALLRAMRALRARRRSAL